jgi:predicted DNA-binding transcriptional regulator YafY
LRPSFGLFLDEKPVEVKIRFDKVAAKIVAEDMFHPTRRLRKHKDGSATLSMKVSGLLEVKFWALWFGSRATVLAPKSLREEVIKELEATRRNYASRP